MVEKLNRVVKERLIEDWHRIRPSGWGMAEMKIAAAYLRRKLPSKYLDLLPTHPDIPLLEVVSVPLPRHPDKYYLGFKIYLKKPREILLIDSEEHLKHTHRPPEWMNEGIKLVTAKELSGSTPYIHSHNITLLFDQVSRNKIETSKIFPLRWLIIPSKLEREEIYQTFHQDIAEGINLIWGKWIHTLVVKKLKNLEYALMISEDQLIEPELYRHKKIALFDKHGDTLQRFPELKPQLIFYEKYSANSSIGKILGHIKTETAQHQMRIEYELIEAAITEVVVLDERIQQILNEATHQDASPDLFKQLRRSNVFIPEMSELVLFKKNFGESELEILYHWLKSIFERQNIDFLVLHIGLVEKMIGKTKVEEINDFLERFIRSKYPHVEIVLITGRGKPLSYPPSLYVTFLL